MKKKIGFVLLAVVAIGVGLAAYGYSLIHSGFAISETQYIYIDAEKDYEILLSDVENVGKVESLVAFERVASYMNYPSMIKTGKYAIEPDMSVVDLVRRLRRGEQTPQNITFNNIRTKEDLAMRLSEQLMITKEELIDVFDDGDALAQYGFNTYTIPAMFIPNTYEFYWDVNIDSFLSRMKKEHDRFWTKERLARATELNLTPTEVAVLASIVEEECTFTDEYPMVAGLYLNRLRRGQRLQADPTVKFAVGDFGLRRVLNIHLEAESPYNTYLYAGLPPGPIRVPSIKGLESVLNYSTHKYIFMCAKDDFSGRHNFAVTLAEHERNARLYRQALNNRSIYK